jgi:hypothetical protein
MGSVNLPTCRIHFYACKVPRCERLEQCGHIASAHRKSNEVPTRTAGRRSCIGIGLAMSESSAIGEKRFIASMQVLGSAGL